MQGKILDLFVYNDKLKFNEIEKNLKIRSNKLAYHLKKLLKKKILVKEGNYYILSETSEYLIPYISEKKSILPAILIHIGNKKQAFLYKRNKRPYKDLLSMPGGRFLVGETIQQATKRIMKEKFNINANLQKINSISLEYVKKRKKIIHSFLLIFISAKTKIPIKLIDIEKNKKQIIKSDYKLIKEHLNSSTKIEKIYSKI